MASEAFNIKPTYSTGESVQILNIDFIPEYDREDYDLSEAKDMDQYIKDIEKAVRLSFEYQQLIQYLRKHMDMNQCSFFEGISNIESTSIKIHIHHSPITLYEIIVIVLEKRKYYGDCLDVEMVAEEVAYLHYRLLIGLIPLCETVHELVHNQFLFVPNDSVMGRYKDFLSAYDMFVPKQVKEKIERLDKYTETYNIAQNMQILQPHYIYLDGEGTYKLPELQQIVDVLNKRMDSLKRNDLSIEPKPFVIFGCADVNK